MKSNLPFCETLVHLMEMQEVSGRELARRTGISAAATNEMKRGVLVPSMKTTELIARALGVPPDTFAEYRLGVVREELDPGAVGLDTALDNLARLKSQQPGGPAGRAAAAADQAARSKETRPARRRSG